MIQETGAQARLARTNTRRTSRGDLEAPIAPPAARGRCIAEFYASLTLVTSSSLTEGREGLLDADEDSPIAYVPTAALPESGG